MRLEHSTQGSVLCVAGYDPFAALGLPARADVTDDEVRAAWRRIAAATHPDLPDGGDPSRFAAAAAAYATLRTRYGRGEAHADLTEPPAPASRRPDAATTPVATRRLLWRVRSGRPVRLAVRAGFAAGVWLASTAVAGWQPATFAIAIGCLTWLIRTTRYDLAPRTGN